MLELVIFSIYFGLKTFSHFNTCLAVYDVKYKIYLQKSNFDFDVNIYIIQLIIKSILKI